jgi:Tol biopolymer transport system component/DNA-binding winged helix-turn-helix (wHTH) protein
VVEKTVTSFQFGPFSLNPDSRVLLKDGAPVAVTGKVLEALVVLVQNRGKVMSKDELLAILWPDTVVEEANLTQNISTLRKVLGDSPKDHRYIVTLPGRGYQFVGEVNAATDEREGGIAPVEIRRRRPRLLWAVATGLAVFAVAGVVWIVKSTGAGSSPTLQSREIPLTSAAGIVTCPSFSPDGKQIAYMRATAGWEGTHSIYTKLIGAGTELRLTSPSGDDSFPAWSPDGQYVAFWRELPGKNGIYLVSALGGPARRITAIEACRGFNWYPDGRRLIVSEPSAGQHFRLATVKVDTGQRQPLTSNPMEDETSPALSPDGKTVAFIGWTATHGDMYVMPSEGGTPRKLTEIEGGVLAWTADGREIVYNSQPAGLWRISITSGTPRRITSSAASLGFPAIAQRGNLLAYVVNEINENLWRMDLSPASPGLPPAPVLLESSTRQQWDPSYSPDGRRLAFGSNRSGSDQIWVSDAQGGGASQITHLEAARPGCPRWSPDGASIAFNAAHNVNSDIYVVGPDGGEPRRVTTHAGGDTVPNWSGDGRWIYFTSARSGQDQIWKVPAAAGESPSTPALQVTQGGGVDAFESVDGKYLYFAKGYEKTGLWRKELGDAKSREEPVLESLQHWGWWALAPQGVYFFEQPQFPPQARESLKFFDLASKRTTQLATLEKPLNQQTAVVTLSPDGRSLVYTRTDRFGSDIMLIENFH